MRRLPLWRELAGSRLSFLRRRPPVSPSAVLVLVDACGDCHTYSAGAQPTLWDLVRQGFQKAYEVECGLQQDRFVEELPCNGDTFMFRAEIHVSWSVAAPAEVVRRRIRHLGQGILPEAVHGMRAVSRRYRIEHASEAESAINDYLTTKPLGAQYGITSSTLVRLRVDEATRAHASRMLKVERDLQFERLSQQLRVMQEQHRGQLLDGRVRHYRGIIELGDIDQFALQLAQNPDEVPAVVKLLRDEQLSNRSQTIDFVTRLVNSGAIDRWEIEQQVRDALDWLRASTGKVIGRPVELGNAGVPQRRHPAGPDAPRVPLPPQRMAADRRLGQEDEDPPAAQRN